VSKLQIKTMRRLFREIRDYKSKSNTPIDYYWYCAQSAHRELHGYINALYQLDIITEKQFDDIHDISSNICLHGVAKKKIEIV
jgi:hypothetical protein